MLPLWLWNYHLFWPNIAAAYNSICWQALQLVTIGRFYKWNDGYTAVQQETQDSVLDLDLDLGLEDAKEHAQSAELFKDGQADAFRCVQWLVCMLTTLSGTMQGARALAYDIDLHTRREIAKVEWYRVLMKLN